MGARIITKMVKLPKGFLNSNEIDSWSDSNDSYSGDWNTCSNLRKIHKVFDKCTETNLKNFMRQKKYAEMIDNVCDNVAKWSCEAMDLGIVGYEVWSVKKTKRSSNNKPVYQTMFSVYTEDNNGHTKTLSTEKTQELADKKAKNYVLENKGFAWWEKSKVLVSGSEEKAEFSIVSKNVKSMPKSVKNGTVVREIHKYYVIGVAAE